MSHMNTRNGCWCVSVLAIVLSIGGCDTGKVAFDPDTGYVPGIDADGDGYTETEDCDDTDASVRPGATEICDAIDNNCNGLIDDGVMNTWYADSDADGFGNEDYTIEACGMPEGYAATAGDCDDGNAEISPIADEVCDYVDNNCDGAIDEGLFLTWYEDADSDTFGASDTWAEACTQPMGYVASSSDCDDTNATINPDATEVCDGIDNDCDMQIDDDDGNLDLSTAETWYGDTDGDGFGDSYYTEIACEASAGYVENNQDCDDTNADINPSVREDCGDLIDNDCDGTVDSPDTLYLDADADGYGDPDSSLVTCEDETGYVTNADDCDDSTSAISPDAAEECDTVDNDCDGFIDESDVIDRTTWYADDDADGYGDVSDTEEACTQPSGYVSDDTDCDDTDAGTNPGADEYCDGHDDDCDGSTDESDAVDAVDYYLDADADGYGDAIYSVTGCSAPTGYVTDNTDCDDSTSAVSPGKTEVCDYVDNDCDTSIDEGVLTTYYTDGDGDGYGDSSASTAEDCVAPSGFTSDTGDCDDTEASVNPGETEVCGDWLDNDCDGTPNTCGFSGTSSLADAGSKWTGEASGDEAGGPLLGGCDLNDDGDPDIVFASHENGSGTTRGGAVYVVFSSSVSSGTVSASTAGARIYGSASSGYFGSSLACGDLDGDGSDDLVVGAPGVSSSAGRMHVFMGPFSGSMSDADADMTRSGIGSGDETGAAVAVGDLDHDGYDDLVVSVPMEDSGGTSAGGVYIEFGPVNTGTEPIDEYAIFLTGASGDQAGSSLVITDIDADGGDDLLIGAPGNDDAASNAGAVYILEGPLSTTSGTIASVVNYTLTGEVAGDAAGAYLMTGDVDTDGYDDLMVGVPAYDDTGTSEGALYLFLTPVSALDASLSTADLQLVGQSSNDEFGTDAAVADVNGDGDNDLIVSALGDDGAGADAGTAYVWLGPVSVTATISTIDGELQGESAGDNAGECLEAAGDVDGDGYDDVLICALGDDDGGSAAGATYLFLGTGL